MDIFSYQSSDARIYLKKKTLNKENSGENNQ